MSKHPLSKTPLIEEGAKITDCTFGRFTEIGTRTILLETTLDDYSYIGRDCEVAYTTFGKFCSIASHTRINPGNHPMDRVTQAHFTYRANRYWPDQEQEEPSFFDWRRSSPVIIGHDVWIGHGAIVLAGRKIGTGAVIGAGSVVTKDIEPYAIAVGNPARTIRFRFSPEIIEGLLSLKWWDWEHERLRLALHDFQTLSPSEFLEKHKTSK